MSAFRPGCSRLYPQIRGLVTGVADKSLQIKHMETRDTRLGSLALQLSAFDWGSLPYKGCVARRIEPGHRRAFGLFPLSVDLKG